MLDAAELVSELEANPSLLNDVDKDGNNIPLTLFSLCVSSFLFYAKFHGSSHLQQPWCAGCTLLLQYVKDGKLGACKTVSNAINHQHLHSQLLFSLSLPLPLSLSPSLPLPLFPFHC